MTTAAPQGLFVGLTTLDVVHRADRRPGPNEKITAGRQDLAAGGPAANAAVTFAALGGRARLITALGAGAVATVARQELAAHGVEVVDVVAGQDRPVPVSAVLVAEATGERSVVSLDAAQEPPAPDDAAGLVGAPDVVLVDSHLPALAAAVLAHRRPGVPALLDTGRWKPRAAALLAQVDVAVVPADLAPPAEVLHGADVPAALLRLGARTVVRTDGADPVRWWTQDGSGSRPVPAVPARDTLGAGDVFHGAYAAALARGFDTPTAVEAACAVAAHRVQTVGPRAWLEGLRRWW